MRAVQETAGSYEGADLHNGTQEKKRSFSTRQSHQQWPLKNTYLKIFLLQYQTLIPVPCLFSLLFLPWLQC